MSQAFTIHQLGHPVLRQRAQHVKQIDNADFQARLDQLLNFVLEQGGMGIAAPQVGISEQVFILSSHPNQRYPYAPNVEPFFVINPSILDYSADTEKGWEGCLSLPGIRAIVPRSKVITVKYQDRRGMCVEAIYDGFLARVFQHEFDHLQGMVFLDRIESTLDVMMEAEWQKQFVKK